MSEVVKLKILLAVTLICFMVGLVSPIITMTKFIFIENTFSVLSGIVQLLKEQQFFLFIIIAVFSIVVPLIKIGVLFKLLDMHENKSEETAGTNKKSILDKYLHWMHLYGKWSMLDVFVVAVLVVAVKLGAIASVEMRYGLYFFATAVLLMMVLTARVVSLMERYQK